MNQKDLINSTPKPLIKIRTCTRILRRGEETNPNLPDIKVYVLARLMCHIAPKVPSHEAVPNRGVPLRELGCDSGSYGALGVVLAYGLEGDLRAKEGVKGGGEGMDWAVKFFSLIFLCRIECQEAHRIVLGPRGKHIDAKGR